MSSAIMRGGRAAFAAWRLVGCALAIALAAMLPAHASGRHASFILDANTGRVLHASEADAPRYPASLTKMMTLYIVFELLEQRRLKPTTQIRFSDAAADTPPSKLGLEAGETISVETAVKALITKSANDVAVAIAEHISGSQARFAALMNRKAREIGMRNTHFRNPHGLPDPEQTTTARDMATLGVALYDRFPRYATLFATRTFAFGGSIYRNHNTMLGRFRGLDGIKTGYTRASGFNLVSSVHLHGKHLVGVVMGGSSASSRNAEMAALLYRALPRASMRRTRKPVLVAARAPQRPAPQRSTPPAAAPVVAAAPAQRWTPRIEIARVRPVSVVPVRRAAAPAPAAQPEPPLVQQPALVVPPASGRGAQPSTLGAQAERIARHEPALLSRGPGRMPVADARDTASIVPVSAGPQDSPALARAPEPATGGYMIQIGAYATEAEAQTRLATARSQLGQVLGPGQPTTETVRVGTRTLYRARFGGYDAHTAASTCLALRRHRVDCLVTRR